MKNNTLSEKREKASKLLDEVKLYRRLENRLELIVEALECYIDAIGKELMNDYNQNKEEQ